MTDDETFSAEGTGEASGVVETNHGVERLLDESAMNAIKDAGGPFEQDAFDTADVTITVEIEAKGRDVREGTAYAESTEDEN